MGCSPWGRKESDTTERHHFHFSLSCVGEGNGNPLQCSCLENPRDRGAWWAAVHGVAQSRTRLKRVSSSSSSPAFESLIHFEFIFVYGVRNCSSFLLLHLVDQFSQHHLLKRLSFLQCVFLFASFVKGMVSIGVWIYLGAFYFVPSIYISVFVPVSYCLEDCSFVE